MAKMLSRVAPWLASRRDGAGAAAGQDVRILTGADTGALLDLARQDAVANVFILSHLETAGTAAPTAGGASLVPVQLDPEFAGLVAAVAHRSGRRYASIFGPAETVQAIYAAMEQLGHDAQEIRGNQPLLAISGPPLLAPNPALGFGHLADFDRILPACAAMFEEEVGYSPYLGGREYYSRRVKGLIRAGHSLVHLGQNREVVFKAELGAVTPEVTQVQGVWMDPAFRGLGLSAGYMAAVVVLAQTLAPVTSLYVNDFNTRARASYERVGFHQVGTFATVLF